MLRDDLGYSDSDAGWQGLSTELGDRYIRGKSELARRQSADERARLYRDDGAEIMDRIIDEVFRDAEVRRLRKQWVRCARFDNALRRIVAERSTVYDQPAARHVLDGDDAYQRVQTLCSQDVIMRRAQHAVNLHNECFLRLRVRRGQPLLEVIAPDQLAAVAPTSDPTLLVAIILDASPGAAVPATAPHYLVLHADESFYLDKSGRVLRETWQPNALGRIPGLLLHREPPDGALLDSTTGDDMVAAAKAAWFLNVCLLKEARTINKQIALTGDFAGTARGQAMDTGEDVILGAGVGAQTLDRQIDLRQFRETADHVIERAAANYGIPPSVLRQEGASSGFEIQLRLLGLRERRQQQLLQFREVERELVQLQSQMLSLQIPDLAFAPDGWIIDFGDVSIPVDEEAQLRIREKKRQMGLANTVTFLVEDNPEMSQTQALERLEQNIGVETYRNVLMRPLAAAAGSLAGEEQTPSEVQ